MVKLKDIAAAVGVSNATVSRVMSNDPSLSVSADTRRAIIAKASELKYTPRRARTEVQADRSIMVHVGRWLGGELEDPYYAGLRLGIERCCFSQNIQVSITSDESAILDFLKKKASGAIVIGPVQGEFQRKIETAKGRAVMIDAPRNSHTLDNVFHDLYGATARLLDDLWEKGYRRPGFIGGESKYKASLPNETRHVAYSEWMERKGIFDPALVCVKGSTIDLGFESAMKLLESAMPPDVIIACTDSMAIGAYRAAQSKGLEIPKDISVVGFNDNPASEFLNPPLSSIRLAPEVAGTSAVEMLVEQLGGRDVCKSVVLQPKIVWRASTR
ncbi:MULTISPECIES: LacI family DNA-binding transcriptional regulator [Halocynthiibacter]|uniref:LacI family DNA-binding transcriptional regulator n=1 Tax=Halocynthiibacter halioticoli TaxID=2986804 RepID=A0AAE3J1X0_9RHOB|nr:MULTISPECIES: LacI family DNA-binding transcriptional regulator [Halocynthiibacter]MCV6825126.1 LacI family DNA-binding transcriptional regulator [Halocynthiibacter halioticoli]MCW4058127.1 LacI family DNA-binding transcriptional regulator [Halocynthiibacter sp. SDUM655004]